MNYFDDKIAAERYAKGRPDFHANTIGQIKSVLQLDQKFDSALDIACGTGLSAQALLMISENVYATDLSREMLNCAARPDKIRYSQAAAEDQPFQDGQFDLITVSSGVHWFDIDRFLAEAHRLLKVPGWLILYENYFIADMPGEERFGPWFKEVYLERFPSPPRNNSYAWDNENLLPKGFEFIKEERFKNSVIFNRTELALYFTTQSNVIAAVEKGQTTYAEADAWLASELALFFSSSYQTRTVNYGNWIKFIQRL